MDAERSNREGGTPESRREPDDRRAVVVEEPRRSRLPVVLGVLFLLVIVGGVLWQRTSGPAGVAGPSTPPPEIADITDLSGVSGGMSIELTDKANPDKLVGVLEADSFEPVGVSERRVEKPRAWVFFEDGRWAYVEAATGRFFMPTPDAAPESGELAGDVRLRLYAPADGGGGRPDPETTVPLGTATFEQPLQFDFKYARLSSSGPFVVATEQVEFRGRFLTAVVNQVRQRLEVLEVRQGGSVRAAPRTGVPGAAGTRAAGAEGTARTGGAVAGGSGAGRSGGVVAADEQGRAGRGEATTAKVDLYRAAFSDAVSVTRGTQRVRGDQLDVWMRLVDNALPEGAIATLEAPAVAAAGGGGVGGGVANGTAGGGGRSEADAASGVASRPAPARGLDAGDADAPIVLEWSGPMRILPLPDGTGAGPGGGTGGGAGEQAAELAQNDLYLRLTAERTGSVTVEDSAARATARAASLDYALTTADLTLSGPGGAVQLRAEGSGTLDASRLVANLKNGVVLVRGPGVLMVDDALRPSDAESAGPLRPTQIAWNDQAEFFFDARSGRMTGSLERAELDGDVQALDGRSELRGQRLAAAFVDDGAGGRRLTTLDVAQGRADDGQRGFIEAAQIHVDFLPGTLGREIDPSRLFASGDVRAGREGALLRAQTLDARLARDFEGQIGVSEVVADGAVEYVGADGVRVAAERMLADAVAQLITLRSDAGTARVASGGATVSGSQILIDGRARTARVVGPGRFDLAPEAGETGTRRVEATWADGMSFDDAAGRIECFGQAAAVSHTQPLEADGQAGGAEGGAAQKDTLAAARVLIELSPGPKGDAKDGASGQAKSPRTLVRATAYGTVGPEGVAQPASVESRLYLAEDADRVERLFFLEGMEIAADNVGSTLTVPGAGKLLMLDRRDRSGERADQGSLWGELASAGPGLTRFEWRDGMRLERSTGRATMNQRVRLRHKSLADGSTIDLQSDRLSAEIRELQAAGGSAGSGSDAVRGELVRADATGSVYFAAKGRELVADQVRYDAGLGQAVASTLGTNQVSYFDPSRGSPMTTPKLTWDLRQDRITLDRPGAFSAAGP